MIKRLLPFMKKYKKQAWLSVFFAICEAVLELILPLIMAAMIDRAIPSGNMGLILKYGALMVGIALVSLTCGLMLAKCAATTGQGLGAELRLAEYKKIQTFSFHNIEKFSTASLITRLTTDITAVQNSVTMGIKLLVRAPIMMITAIILALLINVKLSIIFMIAAPVLIILVGTIVMNVRPRFKIMQEKIDKLNRVVQENLIAARVVKAFVRDKEEKRKFEFDNNNLFSASLGAFKVMIMAMPSMQFVMFSNLIAIYWFGSKLVAGGEIGIGELTSFAGYAMMILTSLMMVAMVLMMVSRSIASIGRIIEVLDEEPDIKDPDNAIMEVPNGDIEFKNVSFKYNDESKENTLHNLSFKIKSGETVGVIGTTGSGKTSMIQLIPRLYDASEGEVFVGDHNVKEYDLEVLRDSVSVVLQKNTLFSGSITSNLKWGKEDATMEEIETVSVASCSNEFIGRLPGEYEMDLGQGGVNVSGGQKQRLCIARALLKSPKVLILDDSTSAVDTATDAKIREGFKSSLKDATKIIIAQRITSVCEADKIIVMEDGKIVDIGTHDELMDRCENYRDVYISQQEGVGLSE